MISLTLDDSMTDNIIVKALIKKIEEQERLLESYREQVLSMEQAIRNTFKAHDTRITNLEKRDVMGVRI